MSPTVKSRSTMSLERLACRNQKLKRNYHRWSWTRNFLESWIRRPESLSSSHQSLGMNQCWLCDFRERKMDTRSTYRFPIINHHYECLYLLIIFKFRTTQSEKPNWLIEIVNNYLDSIFCPYHIYPFELEFLMFNIRTY